MLDNGHWERLKKYWDTEYTGIMANEKAVGYAKEIVYNSASVLKSDYFDDSVMYEWIKETEGLVQDDYHINNGLFDDQGTSEIDEQFPNLWSYKKYHEEIASYFLNRDLDKFREELNNNNSDYIAEALRLEWMDMIEELPKVKEMFIF